MMKFIELKKPLTSLILVCMGLLLNGCGGQITEPKVMQMSAPAPVDNIIVIAGLRTNFTITKTVTGFDVKNNQTLAIQTISNVVTKLKFNDFSVNLLVGDVSKTISASDLKNIIELYVAFFNRIPDADGMAYWIAERKNGVLINQIASNFYAAGLSLPDITGYTSNMSNADFVRLVYKNVLGRTGDTAPPDDDVNYWANEIALGRANQSTLVSAMLFSAHSYAGDATWGWVPQLLDNKVEVGNYFSIQQGMNYNTPEESITQGVKIAAAITPFGTTTAKSLIGVNDALFDLTAPVVSSDFAAVQVIVNARCVSCHNSANSQGKIALSSTALIIKNAQPLYIATVVTKAMPQDNPPLTAAQLSSIDKWFKNGAK
jgi:hypothetical protein